MSESTRVVQGPWRTPPRASGADTLAEDRPDAGGRLVLALVVRECAVDLGHEPSARELADWANHQRDDRGDFCLFGRAISAAEAAVILKHPTREVTVRPGRAAPRRGLGLVGIPGRVRD